MREQKDCKMDNRTKGIGPFEKTMDASRDCSCLRIVAALVMAMTLAALTLCGCSTNVTKESSGGVEQLEASDLVQPEDLGEIYEPEIEEAIITGPSAEELRAQLMITEDFRESFVHGPKGAEFQKYIVLHDTEGEGSASSVVNWWDSNGNLIAAHFVINKDGSIVQCAPLDAIVHHAGFGDTGHNELYGVSDESRDDKLGTKSIGSWASDYGMNSYSIGIEMVHVGGSGDYPEAQLEALDALIAYIDAYYGFESEIIDHKSWRTGNSDTSAEFAQYFENYKVSRTHDGL